MTITVTVGSLDPSELFAKVLSLSEVAAASKRFSSDLAGDAAGDVMARLLESPESDASDRALSRAVAAAVSRLHYADSRAVALTAEPAERTDRGRGVAWESLTESGKRATAAALTTGDTSRATVRIVIRSQPSESDVSPERPRFTVTARRDGMTLEAVESVLAAHSGVSGVRSRSVESAVFRAAYRESESGGLSEPLAALVAPRAVESESDSPARRTAGARWGRVSTAAGPFRLLSENPEVYGSDAGSVTGLRLRDSDAGNSLHSLWVCHSAESVYLSEVRAAATVRAAASRWAVPESTGRGRPNDSQRAAWDSLESFAERTGATGATVLYAFLSPESYSRSGERIRTARVAWDALATAVGCSSRPLARAAYGWALATAGEASRATPESYSTRERVAFPALAFESGERVAFARWESARRLWVSLHSPSYRGRRKRDGWGVAWKLSAPASGDRASRQAALAVLAWAFDASDSLPALAVETRPEARFYGSLWEPTLSPSPAPRVPVKRGPIDPRYGAAFAGEAVSGTVPVGWRYVPEPGPAPSEESRSLIRARARAARRAN